MKMERVMIQLPTALKTKLDAKRQEGYSAAGFIRHLVEAHFAKEKKSKKRAA